MTALEAIEPVEPPQWSIRILGGTKDLALWWRREPEIEVSVPWRLYQNVGTMAVLVTQGVLTREKPLDRINMQPVYHDPNISHAEVALRFVDGDIFLWADVPLTRSSGFRSVLQVWPAPPGPEPMPDPDDPPPDPFDPPVDDLGHLRLSWGSEITPTIERPAVLDFLWFNAPPSAAAPVPGGIGPFVAFSDGGGDPASLPLVVDYVAAVQANPGPDKAAAALAAMQTAAQGFLTANWPLSADNQSLALAVGKALDDAAADPSWMLLTDLDTLVEGDIGMTPAAFETAQITPADGLFSLVWQLLYAVLIAAPTAAAVPAIAPALAAAPLLARAARGMSLIARLVASDQSLGDPEVRRRLRQALPVAPPQVVPPSPAGAAAVELLGVGVQKRIDQQLKGYRLGEIADVINVMPGEQLTLVDRDRSQTSERETDETRDRRIETRDERWSSHQDLAEDLRDALSQTEVIRDYTSMTVDPATWPDLAVSGSWWGEDGGQERKIDRAAKFVETLSTGVISRQAKGVLRRRATATLREQENTQTRQIDNRGGERVVRGAYHWLEKVYELRLRSLGRRLVLECLLVAPGDPLRQKTEALPHLAPVLPPSTWGISAAPADYATVTAANYASAAAAYGLALPPPPVATATVRVEISTPGQAVQLVIPPGFSAPSVTLSYVLSDATLPLVGLVGATPVTLTPTAPVSPPPPVTPPAAGSGGTPPVIPYPLSYAWTAPTPGSGTGQAAFASGLTGTVPILCQYDGGAFSALAEAACASTTATAELTAWQIATHGAIVQAYDDALVAHDQAMLAAITVQASQGVGRLISQQLTLQALAAIAAAAPLAASAPLTAQQSRFFSDALDWSEATYAFFPWGVDPVQRPSPLRWAGEATSDRDAPAWLTSFLTAGSARMLVTVRRGYEIPVLFFLAFGYLPGEAGAAFTTEAGRLWLGELMGDQPLEPDHCWRLQAPTEHAALVANEAFLPGAWA